MKVFQVNDYDCYTGNTLDEAIEACMADCGLPRDEATDKPRELSEEEMGRRMFRDDDGSRRTFRAELDRLIAAGETKPQMFASSEY